MNFAAASRIATGRAQPAAGQPELTPVTVPQLIRMHSLPALLIVSAWLLCEAARAFVSAPPGASGPWFWVGATVVVACLVLLLRPGPDPMPLRPALVLVALPTLAAAANVLALAGPHQHNLDALWAWSPGTTAMAFLVVRGRLALAWVGQAGMTAVYLAWAVLGSGHHQTDVSYWLTWQLSLMLAVTLFALAMRNQVRAINATRERRLAVAAEQADASARERERDHQLTYLNAHARDLLERLRQDGVLDPHERRIAKLTESRLRDRIRAPALATEPLLDAATLARSRGATVSFLDDSAGAWCEEVACAVRDVVLAELVDVTAGSVTVRVLPTGRAALCTVLVSTEERFRRVEVARAPDGVGIRAVVTEDPAVVAP